MTNPLISIIVPNYNHASFLEQRLESVFNQTFQDFEVILLDDCSTDDSVSILKNYEDHPKVSHLLINTTNSGSPFKQWQKGISLAQGTYLWIAESDDYSSLDFLKTTLQHLDDATGLCYVQSIDVDQKGNVLQNRLQYTAEFNPNIWEKNFTMEGALFVNNYVLIKNVIPNASAVLFKKSEVNTTFFDDTLTHMRMCGDWLFWMRLCFNTKVTFVATPLNFFRNHPTVTRAHSSLQKKQQRLQEEYKVRKSISKELGITNKALQNQLQKQWFSLFRAKDIFKRGFYRLGKNINVVSFATSFLRFSIKRKIDGRR